MHCCPNIHEALQTNPLYSAPNLSTLASHSSQLAALRCLCVAAVRQFTFIRAQERLISKTLLQKLNKHNHNANTLSSTNALSVVHSKPLSSVPIGPSDDVSALTKSFMSPAEQTMRRYQPAPVTSREPIW